jgi:hypothetical protein
LKEDEWCDSTPQHISKPEWALPDIEPVDPSNLKEGGVPHTLHTHCKRSDGSEEGGTNVETNTLVGQLTQELAENNLLSMTREIFTMYACVRWAPDASYMPMANASAARL